MLSEEEKEAVEHIKAWIKFEEINGAKLTEFKLVLNLIEKQSKEIEELKAINKMQEYRINEMDIPKSVAEQRERKAYIKGTNDADELCNKKWEDKIKAKIEELEKQDKESKLSHNYLVIPVLQSLLKKE